MELLVSILTVYGISAIITLSKIFEPIRDTMQEKERLRKLKKGIVSEH